MPIGVFRIGAISRQTGLTPATLRLWEERYGLLTPERSPGGTRLYTEADVERVRFIRSLVEDRGYTLEGVARLIDETDLPSPSASSGSTKENAALWEAINREYIEEGRRMAALHPLLRQLIRAESGWSAAVTLVKGLGSLTGAHTTALGLYRREANELSFRVNVVGGRVRQLHRPALPVAEFPHAWQEAIHARVPYWESDLRRLNLHRDAADQASEDETRSFYAEPLTIDKELVGVLVIGSPRPGDMSREARQLTERLAVPAGPAIYYFASGL